MPTLDPAAALSLQAFTIAHTSELPNALPFAHMVTSALNGEEWAVERLCHAITRIEDMQIANGLATGSTAYALEIIRATDCTRPDGGIARSFVI